MLFFHDPNQSSTSRIRLARASATSRSRVEKSNRPSSGSTRSQYTGARTVFMLSSANFGQNGSR